MLSGCESEEDVRSIRLNRRTDCLSLAQRSGSEQGEEGAGIPIKNRCLSLILAADQRGRQQWN